MGVRVDHDRMVDVLTTEGQLLTAATHDARRDRSVPGPSGRTLGETVRHIGDLCEHALSWMGSGGPGDGSAGTSGAGASGVGFDGAGSGSSGSGGGTGANGSRRAPLPEDAGLRELTGRFTARLAELLAEFSMRPPEEPCPTWWPEESTTSFWVRRVVHATTVARVDVQAAADVERTPIYGDVALDGIEEILRVWLEYRLHSLGIGGVRTGSVDVAAGSHRWRVETTPERTIISADTGARPASAQLSGDPWAVYLWLWGRLPDRAVQTSGDADVIAQLWGLLRLATQ